MITKSELAQAIEHTFLKQGGTPEDVERVCAEALEWGFGAVVVNPYELKRAGAIVGGKTRLCTVAGFPLGQNNSRVKTFEIADALEMGANDVDMVMNARAMIAGDIRTVLKEMCFLADLCREKGAISKVILENCLLNDYQKREACRLAVDAGVDFVKTSTGLSTGGATVEDVWLMKSAVDGKARVKAAGGIRTLDTALALLEAGADRLGCSASVAIMREFAANA